MIKIATLAQATEQEVFDQVAKHLLTQNEKSLLPGLGCAYRGAGGTKCAAGCLIGDDEYNPSMESLLWGGATSDFSDYEFAVPEKHRNLIRDLQTIHDTTVIERWKIMLKDLASRHSLSTEVLQEF